MRFLWTLSICLWLATPSARAGEPCECDPGGRPEEPTPEPLRYGVTWIDSAPAGGFYSFVALGDGRLVGAGQRLWRYDGQRWHRQRALRGASGDLMLRLGDGRLAVMHEPSPMGSTDTSRRGALELFGRGGVSWVYPPDGCTLSGLSRAGVEVLAWGQCAVEERAGRVRVEGVALRLEGSALVELSRRPRQPMRALGMAGSVVVMLDERGELHRLEGGRWRRGVPGLAARGWRSLTQSGEALWLGSETGEVVQLVAGEITRLPPLPTRGAVLELVTAGRAVLLRTDNRLWLWDGQRWQDRGATPDDCSAVDYCVGHVTRLAAGGGELWALRDGVPERHFPRAGALPFFEGRAMDEMAVGTRGELFWTRHDARRSLLLRWDSGRAQIVSDFDPVLLWSGADGLPRLVDASGDVFRYDASTGEFARDAPAPCEHAHALLGHGDHAYFSCPGEPGTMRLWTGERYLRLLCPADVCGMPVLNAGVVGTGFPLSMRAPGHTALLVELADGHFALRRRGQWRRIDNADLSVARLEADGTAADVRRVDSAGRVWALSGGQLLFDGPDSFGGGRGIVTDEALPELTRFSMTPDARVIWAADPAGRLFRLSARQVGDRALRR